MVASMKITTFWDIAPCSLNEVNQRFITLMMEAVCTPEISLYFNKIAIPQKVVTFNSGVFASM
jgi:hypothetical protein